MLTAIMVSTPAGMGSIEFTVSFFFYFPLPSVIKAWVNKTKKIIKNPDFIIRLREDLLKKEHILRVSNKPQSGKLLLNDRPTFAMKPFKVYNPISPLRKQSIAYPRK